jgi:glycosyltransferase involved in cell wall biosynthesis
LKGADIGILCSHEEGFANAILEGMAAGLPMIVTNVGGNSEAVIDGVTGLVVRPHDSEALGQAILELAANDATRSAMGKAGFERVEKHFNISRCVGNYVQLYEGLQQGRTAFEIMGSQYSQALAQR